MILYPVVFFLSVLIHETGHMAGGFLSGYSFESIRVCGLMLHKVEKKLCFAPCDLAPIGQCIMLPKRKDCKAGGLLAGGLAANITAAILSGLFFFLCGENEFLSFQIAAFLFIPANILMGAACLIPEGGNDIHTLLELRAFPERLDIYHRLLRIEAANGNGTPLCMMPEEYFDTEGFDAAYADGNIDAHSLVYEMMRLKSEYEKSAAHGYTDLSENGKNDENF